MDLTFFNVFMVFYAIFWGSVAGVQGRWKAFQFPLLLIPRVHSRVCLSMLLLNILPLIFFGYVLLALNGKNASPVTWIAAFQFVVIGVLPVFAVCGFYRLWLGIVERYPDKFYFKAGASLPPPELDEKYWHVEPVYRTDHNTNGDLHQSFVDLGVDYGKINIRWAFYYIVIAALAPWIPT